MQLEFYLVDAFSDRAFAGNACAVVLDADRLSPEMMQLVAREMNQAESAFSMESGTADVRARYFTPAEEIPLAGHPTIALATVLARTGRVQLGPTGGTFSLELQAGRVLVQVCLRDDSTTVTMEQLPPKFDAPLDPAQVAPAFGLAPDDLLPGAAPQVVSTGTRQLMVPLRDLAALRRAALHPERYRALAAEADFFGPHLFCLEGATADGDTFARHFGVPPDLPEDPFTGSASGGMASYLWHHGLIDHPSLVVQQGHWMGRAGQATAEIVGPREAIEAVRVSGQAVVVGHGTLDVPQ